MALALLVLLLCAANAQQQVAALVAAPDVGYEETIPDRWSTGWDVPNPSPFPLLTIDTCLSAPCPLPIGSVTSVAAAGGTGALALDSAGEVAALATSSDVPALWHWKQPEPPKFQDIQVGPPPPGWSSASCAASIVGAEDQAGSVVVSPSNGVQRVQCTRTDTSGLQCKVAAVLAPAGTKQLVAGVSACAAALTPSGAVVVYVITAGEGTVWKTTGGGKFTPVLPELVNNSTTSWNSSLRATALAVAPGGGAVAVATADRLYTRAAEDKAFLWEWATIDVPAGCSGGAVTAPPTALLYIGSTTLYIGSAYGVQRMDVETGAFTDVENLPSKNVTALAGLSSAPDTLFVGTTRGMVRISAGVVRYFYLSRWLPGEAVAAMAAVPTNVSCNGSLLPPAVLVATDKGVSMLTPQCWTLSKKAALFQAITKRHNRYGFAAAATLPGPLNFSSSELVASDNDGSITAYYLASQIYRRAAAAVGSEEAAGVESEIGNATAAIALLQDVTGPATGMRSMARAVVRVGDPHDSYRKWYNSTSSCAACAGWVWKGDCSSDEVVGHVFAWAILGHVHPSAQDQAKSAHYLERLIGGFVDHNFTMLDAGTGLPTTWGRWDPAWINGDVVGTGEAGNGRDHSDNRGVNSLQIIAHLRAAAAADVGKEQKEKFAQAVESLKAAHGYGRNAVNARILYPFDENWCDDENTWPNYYTHMILANATEEDPEMLCSAARSWNNGVRERRGALYAIIHALIYERTSERSEWKRCGGGVNSVEADQEVILSELRDWPLDWLDWPTRNCHRDDVNLRHKINGKAPSREATRNQTMRVLPTNERTFFDWSHDPFDCDGQEGHDGDGSNERYPGVWLLAFWMARYHGFVEPPPHGALGAAA